MKRCESLTPEEVESRYVGLECEPWPDETAPPSLGEYPQLAPEPLLPLLRKVYEDDKARGGTLRLLYLARPRSNRPQSGPEGFVFAGYDFGFFEQRYGHYSVVLNEVIFGFYQDLRAFGKHLNRNLLMDSVDAVRFLARVRERLMRSGADLETWGFCAPAAVYVGS